VNERAYRGATYSLHSFLSSFISDEWRRTRYAKTLPGLAQRITQRLLALTIGMLINTTLGRTLAAYDGRQPTSSL
jgi:hypothetical protein